MRHGRLLAFTFLPDGASFPHKPRQLVEAVRVRGGLQQHGLAPEIAIKLEQACLERSVVERRGPAFKVSQQKKSMTGRVAACLNIGAFHGLPGTTQIFGQSVVHHQEQTDVGRAFSGHLPVQRFTTWHDQLPELLPSSDWICLRVVGSDWSAISALLYMAVSTVFCEAM